jgi:hypothetical protein
MKEKNGKRLWSIFVRRYGGNSGAADLQVVCDRLAAIKLNYDKLYVT